MREFLIKINKEVDKCGGVLTKKRQEKVSKEYRKIPREAEKECPNKNERQKRSSEKLI